MINLYEYQKRYLADLPPRAIMAADTGTGKTLMALAHYQKWTVQFMAPNGGGIRYSTPLLIVAPASKVRTGDWEREITEWFGEGNEPEYEIISYEKLGRIGKKYPNWFKYSPLHGSKQYAVICDEVHRIKSPSTKANRAIWEIARNSRFFVGLSATPVANGWIDFAGYSKLFGFTKGITEFKKKYCNIVTYKGWPEIKSYNNEAELAKQWQSISKPLKRSEALDLPDRVFIGIRFKRPTEYTKTLVTRQIGNEMLDSAPKLLHALRQTLTKPKLDYLSDLLSGTNENVIIFYNYISEREAILDMLKKHKDKKVFRQDGDKHELPSKANWDQVQNSVTLAHYKSGGTGVELTYAPITIYFSPTYSYIEYIQSLGRNYRHGQDKKVVIYNFRVDNSIEEDVYEALRSKQDFQVQQWKGYEK